MMRGDFIADRHDRNKQANADEMYESDEGFDYLDDCESQKLLPPYTTNGINNSNSNSGQFHRITTSTATASATSLNPYTYRPIASRRSNKRYTSWAILTVTLFLLVMVYIPLWSNFHVSTRIGNVARQNSCKDIFVCELKCLFLIFLVPISGWDKNTTRDTSFYVFPQQNTTIIDPAVHICSKKIFLLMVVCSSSVNFEIR